MGFDPVAAFLALLEARFGHLGTFCAGLHGSCLVAVRWHPEASILQSGGTSPSYLASTGLDLMRTFFLYVLALHVPLT